MVQERVVGTWVPDATPLEIRDALQTVQATALSAEDLLVAAVVVTIERRRQDAGVPARPGAEPAPPTPLAESWPPTPAVVYERDRMLDLLRPEVEACRQALFPETGAAPPFPLRGRLTRAGLVRALREADPWMRRESRELSARGGLLIWIDASPSPAFRCLLTGGRSHPEPEGLTGFQWRRVFPAPRVGQPDPPGWRLAVACEDWGERTGIFRGFWPAHVLCGVPPLSSAPRSR
jgi:hypothetical protein